MRRHQYGTPDGSSLLLYEAEKEYEMSGDMARALGATLVRAGLADEVKPEPQKPVRRR